MKTARAFMVAAVTLALVAPRPASADATTDQAKTQFTLGAQAYTAGKYDVAVAAFEEAYRLLPRPEILFSLAQAEKKQCVAAKDPNLLKKALAHYRQYYAMDLPQSARKAEAVESIQVLEQLAMQPELGGVAPTAAAQKAPTKLAVYASVDGAHVFIDGRNQGDVPFVGSVAPGKHTVVVRLAGYTDATRDVVVTEGSTQTIPMTLVERKVGVAFDTASGADVYVDGQFVGRAPFGPAGVELLPGPHVAVVVKNGKKLATREITVERNKPMVVRVPLETSSQRVGSYVVGGLGVVALLGAGAFYVSAFAEQTRAKNLLTQRDQGALDADGLDSYDRAVTNRDALRTSGTIAGAVGVVGLAAGVALFVLDTPDPKSVPLRTPEAPKAKPGSEFEVSLVPAFGPLNGLLARGTF